MGKKEQIENSIHYGLLYQQYKGVALNRFKWNGLPDGLEERHIEKVLFNNGQAVFMFDNEHGFIVIPCTPSGHMNVYGEYTTYQANGYDFHKPVRKDFDCIIIQNNDLEMATRPYIEYYCERLAKLDRTIDLNISQQRHPYLVKVNDKDILTAKNIFSKVDDGEPSIYVDKQFASDTIEVFPTLAPFVADKLLDSRVQILNQLLTFLGINNSNTDKKERLVTDEVNSNNDIIKSNFDLMLKARQIACEKINTMFGLSISVEARIEEVEEVEPIHDNIEGDNRQ